jgi:hypothetical protein
LITTVIAFLTEKVVAVVITSVVVVAAVPTLILAINGTTITTNTGVVISTTRITSQDERTRVVVEVKTVGDAAILKLKNLETSCDVQIEQLAGKSRVSATQTRSALDSGKNNFHASVLPFIHEIEADEDEISHLSVITVETEQAFLIRITTVLVLALGEDGHTGALITVCQTIIVQITQIIVVVTGGGERDNDLKKAA